MSAKNLAAPHSDRPFERRRTPRGRRPTQTEKRASDSSFCCDLAGRLTARRFAVPLREIAAATRRSSRTARARHVAIYLAHVTLGIPLRAVAACFGRDRSTAAYACRVVEDARDDPAFDVALVDLELAATVLLRSTRGDADK
jgi:hypothetical protein